MPASVAALAVNPDTAQSLAAFAADEVTKATIEHVAGPHWPAATIEDGGLVAAAQFLKNGATPTLLVVDLGDSEQPYEDLLGIADSCSPETNVVALGKINDLALYKKFVAAGVADYLVKPVSAEDMEAALLAAALQHAPQAAAEPSEKLGDVFLVVGTRGGVGASTITSNCAWLAAQKPDIKVALLDMDVQYGTSALALDLVPTGGLVEALQNPSRLDTLFMASAMVPKTEQLSILAAEEELGRDPGYAPEAFERLLGEVRRSFEAVWVDMPRGTFGALGKVLPHVKHVFVVSDLSLVSLRDAVRIKAFCNEHAAFTGMSVILNKIDKSRQSMTVAQFERGVETKAALKLADDFKALDAAAAVGKVLAETAKRHKLVAGYRQVLDIAMADPKEAGKAKKKKKAGLLGGLGKGKK